MTTATPDDGGLTFIDYLRPIRRFKFLIALVVIVAAAATYVYEGHKPKIYQTSTQLYVGQSSLDQLLDPSAQEILSGTNDITDQAVLLQTPTIARVVLAHLRLHESPGALLGAIQASANSGADFITITATSINPALAARIANGFVQAYIQVAGTNLVSQAKSALAADQTKLSQLAPGSANTGARTGLRSEIGSLESIITTPPPAGRQVAPAGVPSTPASPKPTRDAIFAAAIALVLGIVLAYLFDRGDPRISRLDELELLFELPVLATVPHVRHVDPGSEDPYGIQPALRERFRSLRVNLDLAQSSSNGKATNARVILVTSALPAEGKSTVVRNLALSYREAGRRVAIVEADLRRPVLADRFGLQQGPGLAQALVEGEALYLQRVPESTAQPQGATHGEIGVAVAGTPPDNPSVLLTSARVREIITQLASVCDVVLIDSPPLLAVGDSLPLLGIADVTLLVVRAGTVTRPAAERVLTTIDRVNEVQRVNMLGIVANDVVDDLAAYYGNYADEGTKSARHGRDLAAS